MDGCEHEDANRVGDRVAEQSVDCRLPIVQNVLREEPTEVIDREAAHQRQPQRQKVDCVVEDVESLVGGVEAEAQEAVGEHREEENLQVAVEQHRNEEHGRAVGPEEHGDAVFEEQFEAQSLKQERQHHEGDVESDVIPTDRQEGLSVPFDRIEGGRGVLRLRVNAVVDCGFGRAEGRVNVLNCAALQHVPLLLFQVPQTPEEVVHAFAVVPFVVLIEPKFVEVDEEEQKGEYLPTPRRFVEDSHHRIVQQILHYDLTCLHMGSIDFYLLVTIPIG